MSKNGFYAKRFWNVVFSKVLLRSRVDFLKKGLKSALLRNFRGIALPKNVQWTFMSNPLDGEVQ